MLQCLPLLLGVAAWVVLALRRRRLRGAILLVLCALTMLAPLETVLRQSTDLGQTLELLTGSWGIVLLAVGVIRPTRRVAGVVGILMLVIGVGAALMIRSKLE